MAKKDPIAELYERMGISRDNGNASSQSSQTSSSTKTIGNDPVAEAYKAMGLSFDTPANNKPVTLPKPQTNNYLLNSSVSYAPKIRTAEEAAMETKQGEALSQQRAEEKAKANKNVLKTTWDFLSNVIMAGNPYADIGAQSQAAERAWEAKEKLPEVRAEAKEARELIAWEGRDELLDEYKRLQRESTKEGRQDPDLYRRMQEVREKIRKGDINAGNGDRAITVSEGVANMLSGVGSRIGSGLINAATNYSENAMQSQMVQMSPTASVGAGPVSAPIWGKMYTFADTLDEYSVNQIQTIKTGASALGELAVDVTENVLEMGFDAGIAYATGGSALVPMFIRVYGDSAAEARRAGATLQQQTRYALANGGIEVLTEVLGDGVGKIYGKGISTDITERVIRKLADTPAGMTFLRVLLGSIEEGGEEVVSDLLHPLAESIYNGKTVGENYGGLNAEDVVYDFLVGMAVSFVSTAGTNTLNRAAGKTTSNQSANAEIVVANELMEELMGKGFDQNTAFNLSEIMAKKVTGQELESAEEKELMRWPTANEIIAEHEAKMEQLRSLVDANERQKDADKRLEEGEYDSDKWLADEEGQDIPEAQKLPENAPSEELNATPAERIRNATTKVEKGQEYGNETKVSEATERNDISDGRGYEQSQAQEAGRGVGEERQSDSGTVSEGNPTANGQNESGRDRVLRRATRARDEIEKRLSGASKKFAAKAYETVKATPELVDFVRGLSNDLTPQQFYQEIYTKAVSQIVDNAVNNFAGGKNNLIALLRQSGMELKDAKAVARFIMEGEEPDTYIGEDGKPHPVGSDEHKIQMGKTEISTDSKGRKVVNVVEAGKSDTHIDKDVSSVHHVVKYEKKKGHHRKGRVFKGGNKIFQNGDLDEYYVVDKNGYRDPNVYTSYYDAVKRACSDSKYYVVRRLKGGNPQVLAWSTELGRWVVDTDLLFTTNDDSIAESVTLQESQASDDLNIELSRYLTSYTTTDVMLLDLSLNAFKTGLNEGRFGLGKEAGCLESSCHLLLAHSS